MIPQHLSLSADHQTPQVVVEAARRVMGGIDLDPASCKEANAIVRATTYYFPPHDGMTYHWDGRVFLNPPGGQLVLTKKQREQLGDEAEEVAELLAWQAEQWRTRSRAVMWWRKLVEEYLEGRALEAIFVGFNLDILQASQGEERWPDVLKFPICVPRSRLQFCSNGESGSQPTHGNVIAYLPGRPGDSEKFDREFASIGSVSI